MPVELEKVLPAARRAPHALAILGLVVVLMVSGLVPNVQAALIGCLLMGLLGCVDLPIALSTGRALVLIVGMLPFSLALQRTEGSTSLPTRSSAWLEPPRHVSYWRRCSSSPLC